MAFDLVGQQIDSYQVAELLGEGGMGSVYRAYDVNLRRTVAIKVMHRHLARQEMFQQRFLQEAQSAAALEHDSIIAVHYFGFQQASNLLYMIMSFVPGGSLGDHLQALSKAGQALPLSESLLLTAQIADALDYAHRKGVVHRDIKPDNVLLKRLDEPDSPGGLLLRAVVTDFGLAKILEGGLHTSSGVFMGTLPYMSPEQALGRNLDGRSDVYSLGIMLYQLTTGRLPFDIKSPTDAVQKHSREPLPPPTSFLPSFPAALEATIIRATAKKAAERHPEARQLAAELRQLAAQLPAGNTTTFVFTSQPAVSLLTRLQDQTPSPPSHLGEQLPPLPQQQQLIIARQGQPPQTRPLDRSPLLIGRSAGADVVLDDPNVSRRHVRLERAGNGWQVVDQNSSNGTYLEDSRLLPDVPEPWEAGRTLRVGPYYLRWQAAGIAPGAGTAPGATGRDPTGPVPAGGPVPTAIPRPPTVVRPGATRLTTSGGRLVVDMPTAPIRVAPGQQAVAQIDLLNQDRIIGHYRLAVDGLPAQWTTVTPARVELFPSQQATLSVAIHPPRHSQATAGTHPYRLVITSDPDGQPVAAAGGQIVIEPFGGLASELSPSILPSGGTARLQIRNDGNSPTTFTVSGRDPAEAVNFQFTPAPAALAPGETVTVPVKVAAKRRPWLGREQQLPFELRVQAGDQSQAQPGQLHVRPILPPWVVPLLGALLLLACGLAAFLLSQRSNDNDANEAQAIAQATAAAGEVFAQGTAVAATATQAIVDVTGTAIAVAAAAIGDADRDGLTNDQEATLGLNPNDDDHDDDGFLDGVEVTTQRTNPNDSDTDDDGTPDGQDDTPLVASTATPTLAPPTAPPTDQPTPTSTAPPTETATPPTPASEALFFDGVDDLATLFNDQGDFNFGAFTVEAWIIPELTTEAQTRLAGGETVRVGLIQQGGAISREAFGPGWGLFHDGNPKLGLTACSPACATADSFAIAEFSNSEWQHVAGTYDGRTLSVYLNGNLIDSVPQSGAIESADHILLGAWRDMSGTQTPMFYRGVMDEVRLWNVTRTPEEIQATMNRALSGNEPGLVGYWKFNEGGGQQLVDSSTRGNHGWLGASDAIENDEPTRMPSDVPLRRASIIDGIVAPVGTEEFFLAPGD